MGAKDGPRGSYSPGGRDSRRVGGEKRCGRRAAERRRCDRLPDMSGSDNAESLSGRLGGEEFQGITSAYLFGSEAEGRSHRESDVDVIHAKGCGAVGITRAYDGVTRVDLLDNWEDLLVEKRVGV